jgi:hypothetical protein
VVYRTDLQALAEFSQHLGLAIALLDQFQLIPQRMGGAKPDQLRELEHEARTAWENLWAQLGQARTIAQTLGRDTKPYDVARRAAGDIWLDAAAVEFGPWQHHVAGHRRSVSWRSAPVAPARAAIEALRAAVPEVVVADPAPQNLELRGAYKRVTEYGPLAIIVAAVAWTILHFVLTA